MSTKVTSLEETNRVKDIRYKSLQELKIEENGKYLATKSLFNRACLDIQEIKSAANK